MAPNTPTHRAPPAQKGVTAIDEDECLRLLARHPIGRLGISVAALPVILPINFTLDGRRAVFCSDPGAKVDAARQAVVACLEVDDVDPIAHEGWSVLATGRLRVLSSPADLALVEQLPLRPWSHLTAPQYLSLDIEIVSGRHVRSY